MIFTSEMIQIFAIVLGRDSQRVTEAVLSEGVMQFINISEVDGDKPDSQSDAKPSASLSEISDLRKRIEVFLHTGGMIPSPPNETDLANRVSVNIEKENQHLDKIASERESLRERQRTIQQEVLKLEDIRKQVERSFTGHIPANVGLDEHGAIENKRFREFQNGTYDTFETIAFLY